MEGGGEVRPGRQDRKRWRPPTGRRCSRLGKGIRSRGQVCCLPLSPTSACERMQVHEAVRAARPSWLCLGAKTESKHHFFAWLLVQKKILTADKFLARNWSCNLTCSLCDQEAETAEHLCLQYVFAHEVWVLVAVWCHDHDAVRVPDRLQTMEHWWNTGLAGATSAAKNRCATIMICTAWNIWKERNRRIFDGVSSSPRRVLQLIKDEMALRFDACEVVVQHLVF